MWCGYAVHYHLTSHADVATHACSHLSRFVMCSWSKCVLGKVNMSWGKKEKRQTLLFQAQTLEICALGDDSPRMQKMRTHFLGLLGSSL